VYSKTKTDEHKQKFEIGGCKFSAKSNSLLKSESPQFLYTLLYENWNEI